MLKPKLRIVWCENTNYSKPALIKPQIWRFDNQSLSYFR